MRSGAMSQRRASLLLLLSALGYSVVSLLVTRASLAHMPMMQIMTVRFGMQVVGLLPAMRAMRVPLLPERASRAERGWLGVLSVATFGSAFCYFSACTMLPLGDATSLIGLYPVTTALGGRLWLDEMLGWRGSAAACLAAVGGILVARPPGLSGGTRVGGALDPVASAQRSLGLLLAGSSCLLTTLQYLILRRLGSCAHPTQTMLIFLALAGPAALALHLSTETTVFPSARGALELVAMGLVALVAQGLVFFAAPCVKASTTALLTSSEVAWAFTWQAALLGQDSDPTSLTGAALILAAVALPALAAAPDPETDQPAPNECGEGADRPDASRGVSVDTSLDRSKAAEPGGCGGRVVTGDALGAPGRPGGGRGAGCGDEAERGLGGREYVRQSRPAGGYMAAAERALRQEVEEKRNLLCGE